FVSNSRELPACQQRQGGPQTPSNFEPLAARKLTQPLCEPGFRVRNSRGEVFTIGCAIVDNAIEFGAASSIEPSYRYIPPALDLPVGG
ncbi:MAG: hypothetical protein FWE19_02680, partial [Oscillospiraceae bacterium]|nr:hypothetical protein [Oscillospiraceae bacterium]